MQETQTIEKSLAQIAHYFSYRPTGFYSTVGRIDEKIGQLNKNLDMMRQEMGDLKQEIKKASESSDKLTTSLNNITKVGVAGTIIAAMATVLGLVPQFYHFLQSVGVIL